MSTTRTRYYGVYSYPGLLFAEETSRPLTSGDVVAAIAEGPDDERWYAVEIRVAIEKRFVADDGEEQWLKKSDQRKARYVIGEKVHVDDIPDDDRHSILRSNIRGNSTDHFGVRTRAGNWQIAQDYDDVIPPQAVRG